MNKLILVVIAVIIIAVVGFIAYPLAMIEDAEAQIIDVKNIPDSWTNPCTITIGVKLENTGSVGYVTARIIDRDIVGPWLNDIGWTTSRLAYGYLTAGVAPSYNLPGANGIGSDFHGQIQAGHKSEGIYYIDDTYDFTIPYMSNHAPTVGEISGPSSSQVNELVNFYCNAYDEDGDNVQVKWDLGDGTISDWGSTSITHTYTTANTYYVRVQPKDSQGLTGSWSEGKQIQISGHTSEGYKLTVHVKDKESLQPLENAKVKIEGSSSLYVTDSTGSTIIYNINSGSYSVSVEKDGYKEYKTTVNINQDSVLTVELEKQMFPTSGFEFLTLLIGLIAVIYLKKKSFEVE